MLRKRTMEDHQNTKKVVYGILEFLDEEFKKPTTTADSKESLEVAIQCLETAFGITLRDVQFKPSRSFRESVRSQGIGAARAPSAATLSAGATNPSGTSYVHVGTDYARPHDANDADKQQADELKNKGNDSMKGLNFTEALDYYSKAINLDGNNAIYFCNRAAAYIKLGQYEKALRDCEIAIQLHPSYAKAYGRMGVIYSSQSNHVDEILCYRKALELEPENESYQKNLQTSQHMMLQDVPAAQAQAAASPNLQNVFNNPNLINMASQMLEDPSMQQMTQSIMTSYQGGATPQGAGGAGMESLVFMGEAIARQIQNSNPNFFDQLTGYGADGRPPSSSSGPDNGR